MSGNTRSPLGIILMNIYCVLWQRGPATARLVSKNLNGPVWKNIQQISKKMFTSMGSPIISRSNKEAIIFFVNDHKRNFEKDEKLAAKVSIDAIKILSG